MKKLLSTMCMGILVLIMLVGCNKKAETADIRIGSLKGPTSIGLVELMEKSENGETGNNYTFTMEVAADTLITKMVQKELDIALVPANVASVLYNKTEGEIFVIDINTLGVLYMVSADDTIMEMKDLIGKTIYLTGKGTTPDFVLQYVLEENNISLSDVTLEYKSEATEVAAVLATDESAVGLLPQPFVTATTTKNEKLQTIFDMNEEWNKLQGEDGSMMVTGVTVVRKEFLEENEGAVKNFLKDHETSVEYVKDNVDEAAELVVELGIIEKAPIAQKAIPYCNITYMDGTDMKNALSGYLSVLYEKDAKAIGGKLPSDDFYYLGK